MTDLAITQVWMAGVVGMIIVFAVTALFGYLKNYRFRTKKSESTNGQEET